MLDVCTFEERVILAAQFGRQNAINYLLCKWEQPKNQLVTALAKAHRLNEQDTADARQEAVLWILAAIDNYDFRRPSPFREQRLHAYLRVAIRRRMANYVRGLRRASKFANACRNVDEPAGRAIARFKLARSKSLDPVTQCVNNEFRETARSKVAALGGPCKELYEALQDGVSMRHAVQQLRISFHDVRRSHVRIKRALSPILKPR
ncbi:MAG: hypothetical protein H8E66_14755 [Planctomycetes bacterium]|nr:hypothetical protein [Planctomycetota bacterium]